MGVVGADVVAVAINSMKLQDEFLACGLGHTTDAVSIVVTAGCSLDDEPRSAAGVLGHRKYRPGGNVKALLFCCTTASLVHCSCMRFTVPASPCLRAYGTSSPGNC